MNLKDALDVQREAFKEITSEGALEQVPPQSRWKVGYLFFKDYGAELRKIIDTFPSEPIGHDLVWCLGSNRRKNPGEIIREIVCKAMQDEEPE